LGHAAMLAETASQWHVEDMHKWPSFLVVILLYVTSDINQAFIPV
jgi:hypothetical protein